MFNENLKEHLIKENADMISGKIIHYFVHHSVDLMGYGVIKHRPAICYIRYFRPFLHLMLRQAHKTCHSFCHKSYIMIYKYIYASYNNKVLDNIM